MQLSLIQSKICDLRGKKVMPDVDLAKMYEAETRVLKQAVKRNLGRFPFDFMFHLTKEEFISLRSQIVSLKNTGRGQHSKYLTYAVTEKKYNKNFKKIYHALNLLIEDKTAQQEQTAREPIGFKTKSSA